MRRAGWKRASARKASVTMAIDAYGISASRAAASPALSFSSRAAGAASGNETDRSRFAASLRFLGFLSETAAQWNGRKQQASGVDAGRVDSLIAARAAARARKDFGESDRIRDELAAMGVVIKDSKGGTTWEIAR